MTGYAQRCVDTELDELMDGVPAISIEGPKGVGKTATAARRARTTYALDLQSTREMLSAAPDLAVVGAPPILIDEWQQLPETWDRVRRSVDDGAGPGTFLLTGSASPVQAPTHSGAGRIVTVRMRPMSLTERGAESPTVSLSMLLTGSGVPVTGRTSFQLRDYAREIVQSGFPGMRESADRALRSQLDGYLARIAERDVIEQGLRIRNPATLMRWLKAYAAASSTTASYEKIRDAATSDLGDKPAKTTTQPYRDALEKLWIVEPVPAWLPTNNHLRRLAAPPKHQLADPALAARLLGADAAALIRGESGSARQSHPLLGALFESLVTLDVRTYAQLAEARVSHLRTHRGEREVDLIVERGDGRIVAIEVKLAASIDDYDVRHLRWIRDQIGTDLLDAVIVTSGPEAYRRADGIAVVPAALLGP